MVNRKSVLTILVILLFTAFAVPQISSPQFVGMGDSIGEGVQTGDASYWSQPYSYLNLIALRAGASFPLPLIVTSPFTYVGDTVLRYRHDPTVLGLNLAVSGADVNSLLYERADSWTDAEVDLVLMPRIGSQIEVAETLGAEYVACWIGNNDALGAVTAYDQLDASQLTPVSEFTQDFAAIALRLKNAGSKVVFGTIPDVASIGFLVPRDLVVALFGSDYGMAPDDQTSVVTIIAIAVNLLTPTVLEDPNFVLSAAEAGTISARIHDFNKVIKNRAAENGAVVADIHETFDEFRTQPPVFFQIPLRSQYLGGLFSLDGVHPSNISHALLANKFMEAFNQGYGANFEPFNQLELEYFFVTDPFVDKDHDGKVTGRPYVGILETILYFLGVSGDPNDFDGYSTAAGQSVAGLSAAASEWEAAALAFRRLKKAKPGNTFIDKYAKLTGKRMDKMSRRERLEEIRRIFGLTRFRR